MDVFMDIGKVIVFSLTSAIVLFILCKIMGNKQISQLNMFDYIVGITIGSIASEMATELEQTPTHFIIAMVIYALLAFCISVISARSMGFRKFVVGVPIILMNDGKFFRTNMKRARIEINDFLTLCRVSGFFDINQIQVAIMEYNGAISFLPKAQYRPVSPDDMGIEPEEDFPLTNVIMDGYIMTENLHATGNNEEWIKNELKKQGYKSHKEVFLATCDRNNNLSVYPMVKQKKSMFLFE